MLECGTSRSGGKHAVRPRRAVCVDSDLMWKPVQPSGRQPKQRHNVLLLTVDRDSQAIPSMLWRRQGSVEGRRRGRRARGQQQRWQCRGQWWWWVWLREHRHPVHHSLLGRACAGGCSCSSRHRHTPSTTRECRSQVHVRQLKDRNRSRVSRRRLPRGTTHFFTSFLV